MMVDHDPLWSVSFALEASLIKEALADIHPTVVHIGSTAIPGICAKPIIDIMAGVDDMKDCRIVSSLEKIGYIFQPDAGEPDRLFFRKGATRTHHLHVVNIHSWTYSRHLIFRDYLLTHPSICVQYGELKRASAEKYRFDRTAYTNSKTEFIDSVLRTATEIAFIKVSGQYAQENVSHPLCESDVLRR
jgi:GrpB-like predicted nucleotidyltransferase (UPF0157 family)